uniref:Uncharacterized protein n=1 Tax=Helianthus annuus TaxID=4232 RepID=A0A251SU63_HELAN
MFMFMNKELYRRLAGVRSSPHRRSRSDNRSRFVCSFGFLYSCAILQEIATQAMLLDEVIKKTS